MLSCSAVQVALNLVMAFASASSEAAPVLSVPVNTAPPSPSPSPSAATASSSPSTDATSTADASVTGGGGEGAATTASEQALVDEEEVPPCGDRELFPSPPRERETSDWWSRHREAKEKRELRRCLRRQFNKRLTEIIEGEKRTFRGIMSGARRARCATALCWGPSYKWALEPLVEIPIGKSFATPASGLARYINSNEIQIAFSAGLRAWLFWDWMSVSIYLSKPIFSSGETIKVNGSDFAFPTSQVRRLLPGFGIGLFADILWLSVDYDQLRNGNSSTTRAPEFGPNEILSHAVTFTIAIAPITALRNGLGTVTSRNQAKK